MHLRRYVISDNRFAFGSNWSRFLARLTPERVRLAEASLSEMVGDLTGRRFLDIGSGSGLFSLAARNLGARVHSFDYDPQSVACTAELRRRYHPNDADWVVEQGSALDERYLRALGSFDVVYSWGVLHHTGQMWRALDLATLPLAADGLLYISLYNRVPARHRAYVAMKWTYVHGPPPLRWLLLGIYGATHGLPEIGSAIYRRRPPLWYFQRYAETSRRGMSWWTDVVDWVGGYPYEAATPAEVSTFYASRGLSLERERLTVGHGCNEFIFRAGLSDSDRPKETSIV